MQAITIKEKLHHYIDVAQEQQLQAIYTLLEDKIELSASNRISIDQYNKEIEEAEARIESGEFYTQAEIKSKI
ncbi:MAG: hypothetical protein KA275_02130 [Chitinophagaceae bacterium]|nr:hypothetical protein [Chitinophagaceae bacterium]